MPWGVEQDLILHERPADPSAFALSSAARLEMLTEQLEGPIPSVRSKIIRRETDPAKLATMAEPHFYDSDLSFGGMKMSDGKAFGLGKSIVRVSMLSNPVGKSFGVVEQRRILVEAVEHGRALPALNALPSGGATGITNAALTPSIKDYVVSKTRRLPTLADLGHKTEAARTASIRKATPEVNGGSETLLAMNPRAEEPAFVLDYQLVNELGETDFTFRGDTTYVVGGFVPLYGTTTIEGGSVIKFRDGTGLYLQPGATLVCDTTNHLPAVLTITHDDSVGEVLAESSGTPYQGTIAALNFDAGTYELRNLRFKHIGNPIQAYGANVTARNLQFVDTYACFWLWGGTDFKAFNVLAKDFFYFFDGMVNNFRVEHLTARNGLILGQGSVSSAVKNSLLVAVSSLPTPGGSYTETASVRLPNDAGVFQTVEGGAHYLPVNTPHRSVTATTDIDAQLKSALLEMTTYAPTVLTGTLMNDLNLLPAVPRDAGTIGYHYPVIDYLTKDFATFNNTLNLRGGVSVATTVASSSLAAVWLSPGKLVSVGTPTKMNRLLRANQVQENAVARSTIMFMSGYSDVIKPEVALRFTDASSLAGEQCLFYMGGDFPRFEACHSAFFNGSIELYMDGTVGQTIGLTNNVFRSVPLTLSGWLGESVYVYNNLFRHGTFAYSNGNIDWTVSYNVFDHVNLSTDFSEVTSDFNAYWGMTYPLPMDGNFVMLTSLAFANGPLGKFYLGDNVLRERTGSPNASALGLYHFTTRADQVKEETSLLDWGFHYAAVTTAANGQLVAIDTDGDRAPDYLEDTDGNGTLSTGETDIAENYTDGENRDDLVNDHEPPTIIFTNEPASTVSIPWIQLKGYSIERLKSISYEVWFGGVLKESGEGAIVRQDFDRVMEQISTNWFVVPRVNLSLGANVVKIFAKDFADNVTAITRAYTFSTSGDTTAPTLTVAWPGAATKVSGTSFTVRGTVDDPTCSIEVITSTGNFYGSPDDQGKFSVDVTVTGSETIQLVTTDYAGNTRTASLAVTTSSVVVTITPPSSGELGSPTITLNGTVSVAPTAVTVNGRPAVLTGMSWSIPNFPMGPDEDTTATMDADATVPDGGGGGSTTVSTSASFEKPPVLRLSLYTKDRVFNNRHGNGYGTTLTYDSDKIEWTIDGGGFQKKIYETQTQGSPGAPWVLYREDYRVDWYPDGSSTWRKDINNNGNVSTQTGTGVPLPGAYQVRNINRAYQGPGSSGGTDDWTYSLYIDSAATLYAQPANIGTRLEVLAAEASELTFDPANPQAMEPGQVRVMSPKEMEQRGKNLNADGARLHEIKTKKTPVPPPQKLQAPAVKNMNYYPTIGGKAQVGMYISFHPLLGANTALIESVQGGWDSASMLLEEDEVDGKRADNEKEVNNYFGNPDFDIEIYLHDDVPAYVKFKAYYGYWPSFPPAFGDPQKYYDVPNPERRDELINAQFANVKFVNSLYPAIDDDGNLNPNISAWGGVGPKILMKFSSRGNAALFAHEFGHTQGLEHRGKPSNPGSDPAAVMHKTSGAANKEINRNERGAYSSPFGSEWNSP